ncbi:MAG: hypothetical protein RMK18_08550 [Armatimonadota bacterium]|nr:hypothetical protein [Armatimonadota bacterium]MCX7777646.1 hypothetical protein [Armatimonadota bacterium]MDW8025892.1 hypothetical protein [Armatimonadota bacterium]
MLKCKVKSEVALFTVALCLLTVWLFALANLAYPQQEGQTQPAEDVEKTEQAPPKAIEVEEPKFVETFDGGAIDLKVFPEINRPQGVQVRVEDGQLIMSGRAQKGQSITANVATPPLPVQPFEVSIKILLPKLPFGAMCGIYISNATPKGEETSNGVAADVDHLGKDARYVLWLCSEKRWRDVAARARLLFGDEAEKPHALKITFDGKDRFEAFVDGLPLGSGRIDLKSEQLEIGLFVFTTGQEEVEFEVRFDDFKTTLPVKELIEKKPQQEEQQPKEGEKQGQQEA